MSRRPGMVTTVTRAGSGAILQGSEERQIRAVLASQRTMTLDGPGRNAEARGEIRGAALSVDDRPPHVRCALGAVADRPLRHVEQARAVVLPQQGRQLGADLGDERRRRVLRSEEHTSELQSTMRNPTA